MSAAGRNRAAYINTGTYSTPVWVHISRISGVQRSQSRATSDRKYRGSKTVKTITGYLQYGFTFKYHVKSPKLATDTTSALLQASLESETVLDVCFLNQRIIQTAGTFPTGANAVGVRGPVVVSKFDISEEDEEGVTFDVELKEVEDEQPSGTDFSMGAISIAVTAG
jgi:hypothetical protein